MSAAAATAGGNGKAGAKAGSGDSSDAAAWIAVAAGTIGALMATLDISITNAGLPQIQGGVGASGTEGTWISTAYLVAEIVMIPLAGWFQRLLGLRTFLLIVTPLFVVFSIICGTATSLGQMIFGRVGQGFTGGAMIPTALTIVSTRLSPSQQPIGIALFGMTAVLGPVLGPLIGGYLTENYSWHYAFFINVPVGIALTGMLLVGLPHEKSHLGEFLRADWLGIIGLALGLGCLTVVLEEGQREQWFESPFIVKLSIASIIGFVILGCGQILSREPVIRLRILRDVNFAFIFILALVLGGALYGIVYIIPQFLNQVPNYNAYQAGVVALVSGIPTLLLMPLFPFLVRRVDIRLVLCFGLLLYGISCMLDTTLAPQSDGWDFVASQVLRGVANFFTLIFLNQAASNAFPKKLAEDASGLFNAGRNLGGSFALAMIATLQERRTTLHTQRLSDSVTANSLDVHQALSSAGPGGSQKIIQQLYNTLQLQATVITFSDIFFVLGCILFASIPLVFFLKPLPKNIRSPAG